MSKFLSNFAAQNCLSMKKISLLLVSVMALLSFSFTSCEKKTQEPYDNSALANTRWQVVLGDDLRSVIEFKESAVKISDKPLYKEQETKYIAGRYELRDTNVKLWFNESWNYDTDVSNAMPLTATLEGEKLLYNNLEYHKVK